MVHVPNFRQFRTGLIVVAAVLCIGCEGCSPESRFPEPFFIAQRSDIEILTGPGTYELEASCRAGEQLLGGGYFGPDLGDRVHAGVVATYPSSASAWTVVFENPDAPQTQNDDAYLLAAYAYCLTTPDYPLDTVVVSEQGAQGSGSLQPSVEVACPPGSVLTGGGYRTSSVFSSSAWYNANALVSAPLIDSDGTASGWQVRLHYFPQDAPPGTTVYAVCARQNLTAGPVVTETQGLTDLPYGWSWADTQATCPRDTFTTAGGYSLIGDPLVPHAVSISKTRSQFQRWHARWAYGYQRPSEDFRPCDLDEFPDCGHTAVAAVCVEVPEIPFVDIEILEPQDGASFPRLPGSDFTEQIDFVAEATDEAGAPLSGGALQWFSNGVLFGTGESVTQQYNVSSEGVLTIDIRVVATGNSTTAYDEIEIFIGSID